MTNNKTVELCSEDLRWFANIIEFLNRMSTSHSGIQIDKVTFKDANSEHTEFDVVIAKNDDLDRYHVEFDGARK